MNWKFVYNGSFWQVEIKNEANTIIAKLKIDTVIINAFFILLLPLFLNVKT
mgnify:CR=1 FL=1